MISITDGIILVVAIFSFWSGWQKGLMRTLLGPLSLLIGTIASYLYYSFTHKVLNSLLIGLIGPIVLNIILSLLLSVWNKTVDNNQKTTRLSRVAGGFLNILWTGGLIVLVLILIVMIPPHVFGLEMIKADLNRSAAYCLIRQFMKDKVPASNTMENTLNVFNPAQLKTIQDTPEYKTLMADEKIQSILSNEETMQQIRRKNIAKLLANPEFLKLFQDEQLMKKILDMNLRLLKEGSGGNSSAPKVYEPSKTTKSNEP